MSASLSVIHTNPRIRHLEGTTDPRPPCWKCKSNRDRTTRRNPRVHRLGDEEYVNDTRHGASDTISLANVRGVRRVWKGENLLHVDQQRRSSLANARGFEERDQVKRSRKCDRISAPRNRNGFSNLPLNLARRSSREFRL